MTAEHDRYLEEMGREPPEPREDDALRWQWDYRGKRDERAALEAELRGEPEPDEPPPSQEETLW